MEKITIRELVERLAKCNWDDEVTCISLANESAENIRQLEQRSCKIVGVSQIVGIGTQIIFDNVVK